MVPDECKGCSHVWIREQMLGAGFVYSGDPPPCSSCLRANRFVDRYEPAKVESAGTSDNSAMDAIVAEMEQKARYWSRDSAGVSETVMEWARRLRQRRQ